MAMVSSGASSRAYSREPIPGRRKPILDTVMSFRDYCRWRADGAEGEMRKLDRPQSPPLSAGHPRCPFASYLSSRGQRLGCVDKYLYILITLAWFACFLVDHGSWLDAPRARANLCSARCVFCRSSVWVDVCLLFFGCFCNLHWLKKRW
jgi:hypothetical protein